MKHQLFDEGIFAFVRLFKGSDIKSEDVMAIAVEIWIADGITSLLL